MSEEIDMVILTGSHYRNWSIASKKIKTDGNFDGDYLLKDEETQQTFFAYCYRIDEETIEMFLLLENASKNQEIELTLSEDSKITDYSKFHFQPVSVKKESDERIDIKVNGDKFTSFHYNISQRPFLMPIIGPYGDPITRQYPVVEVEGQTTDHIHHRSCWTAWGEVNEVDNWSEGIGKGNQEVESITICRGGLVCGHIQANINWINPKNEVVQIVEKRDMFFFNSRGTERQVDFRIDLKASNEDILLGDTKEGGFISVRVATTMDVPKGGIIQNGFGGFQENECWGKRAPWCDYSGVVKGNSVGIALFDNPNNYNFPTYWHVRDYGLMAANPLGLSHFLGKGHDGSITVKKDQNLELNYRMITHAGDALNGKVDEKYVDYLYPAEIKNF